MPLTAPPKPCRRCGRPRRPLCSYCDLCREERVREVRSKSRRRLLAVACIDCGAPLSVPSWTAARRPRCPRCKADVLRRVKSTACTAPVPGGCPLPRLPGRALCEGHRKRRRVGGRMDTPIGARARAGRCMWCGCREDCPGGCVWIDSTRETCSRCERKDKEQRR